MSDDWCHGLHLPVVPSQYSDPMDSSTIQHYAWHTDGMKRAWVRCAGQWGWKTFKETKTIDLVKDSSGCTSVIFDGQKDERSWWHFHEFKDESGDVRYMFELNFAGSPESLPKQHMLYQIMGTQAYRLNIYEGTHCHWKGETVLLLKDDR